MASAGAGERVRVLATRARTPLRAGEAKTTARLGQLRAGEELTLTQLRRTASGTVRGGTARGWLTLVTKAGRPLVAVVARSGGTPVVTLFLRYVR